MSFTYDPSQLSTSKVFQVRFKIGATTQYSVVSVADEEIQYALDQSFDDINQACLIILNSQISRAAAEVDKDTGQVSEANSQLLKNLIALRNDIINAYSRYVPIYAEITGVFEEDRKAVDSDPEIYQDGVKMDSQGIFKSLFSQETEL